MNNRLAVFGRFTRMITARSSQGQQPVRKLYTDHIYPYPFRYMNEVKYPSQVLYRETWRHTPWGLISIRDGTWIMRLFWSWWFYQLFHHPEALYGHTHLPDPTKWTDAELGVPPDDVGLYSNWLEEKYGEI